MSDYQWCLFCQRATRKQDPIFESDQKCPTPNCQGALGNLWDWDVFRLGRKDLPVLPEDGKIYQL